MNIDIFDNSTMLEHVNFVFCTISTVKMEYYQNIRHVTLEASRRRYMLFYKGCKLAIYPSNPVYLKARTVFIRSSLNSTNQTIVRR